VDVVDHVAEPSGGVDRLGLAAAEAAQVRGDHADVVGQPPGDVAPPATGDQVAVHEQQRHAVVGPARPYVRFQPIRPDH
jgi:hypothetical protein